MLQTQHSERVTAPHEEYCMTRAHLSPYRDASKQVADKLRFFRGASPGTPPSVCAPSLYLFVGRQTGARVTLCCSQSLCVAARLQSQQKLLFHRTGLLAAGVTHQVCFLKITHLRRQTCFRARRYGINILW